MLVVTKSLRGYYKNPDQIAHKVLADRMGVRDPGNKPASNDRIPYAYIEVKESKNNKVLQGDRIEHPDYMEEKNIYYSIPYHDIDLGTEDTFVNGFTSGYLMRSMHLFPKQGEESPWRNNQKYFEDVFDIRFKSIDDGSLLLRS